MFWRKKIVQKAAQKRTVLFVDDDEIVLASIERGLLDESYEKLFAKSGEEALEILQREEVHVIVTDMYMHGMTGLDLLTTVRKDYPHIIGMVLSGHRQDSALESAFHQGEIFRLIRKPWKTGEVDFERTVRKAIDHYNLRKECRAR